MTSSSSPVSPPPPAAAGVASSSSSPPSSSSLNISTVSSSLELFCLRHAAVHRPIVVVTSGGTAADLEVRTVRSVENFSTGLRGALSVEEFLERGYAVVHLWRTGSASPFARAVSQALGLERPDHGLSAESLHRLFENSKEEEDSSADEPSTNTQTTDVAEQNDPWLMEDPSKRQQQQQQQQSKDKSDAASSDISLQLHHRLCNNEHLQRAWRQWRLARTEHRIMTVPFRTVEEYLERLEHCSRVVHEHASALSMMYLAAAVSDYYVPNKAEHKIQSGENAEELVLTMEAVPKVLGKLRSEWAPEAFCVSFKLETDGAILRRKAEDAVTKYGVHMVVGNILETRYSTVHVLHPDSHDDDDDDDDEKKQSVHDWTMTEIRKSPQSLCLEIDLIEFVAQQHFSHISKHYSFHAALETHERLVQRKRELQRQLFWNNLQESALQIGGTLLGMTITYLVSQAIQRRILMAR